jgi:hypothetical protein
MSRRGVFGKSQSVGSRAAAGGHFFRQWGTTAELFTARRPRNSSDSVSALTKPLQDTGYRVTRGAWPEGAAVAHYLYDTASGDILTPRRPSIVAEAKGHSSASNASGSAYLRVIT